MKKYVLLIGFTLLCVAGLWGARTAFFSSVVEVSCVKVDPVTAKTSVVCTGQVERAEAEKMLLPAGAFIDEVHIKAGDEVEKGQALLSYYTVESESTLQDFFSDSDIFGSSYSDEELESIFTSQGEKRTLTAPADGSVSNFSVREGDVLTVEKEVLSFSRTDALQVVLLVNEAVISSIQVGQQAEITGSGFPGQTFSGIVQSISEEAQQSALALGQEVVVEVVVSLEDPTAAVKPGFSAKVRIITGQDDGVLLAPYEAVRASDNGDEYVYRMVGRRAVRSPIRTGEEFETGLEVVSGLHAGDALILNPDAVWDGGIVTEKKEVSQP